MVVCKSVFLAAVTCLTENLQVVRVIAATPRKRHDVVYLKCHVIVWAWLASTGLALETRFIEQCVASIATYKVALPAFLYARKVILIHQRHGNALNSLGSFFHAAKALYKLLTDLW